MTRHPNDRLLLGKKGTMSELEMDPDLRVREAIRLVFARFAEMQTIRQVFLSESEVGSSTE